MQFTFQMHSKTLISVACRLKCTTHFTNFHIFILLLQIIVNDCLELCLLFLELFNFIHYSLSFFNFTLFTQILGFFVIYIDFRFELVDFLVSLLLLRCVHLWLI